MKAFLRCLWLMAVPLIILQPLTSNGSDFGNAAAQDFVELVAKEEIVPDMLVNIELHTPEEVKDVLLRAEKYVDAYNKFPQSSPIVFILHGDEAEAFRKENYQQYKELVDLAARLEAYKVVDIKVCEMWMRKNNMEAGDVPAFVDTVTFGPWEEFKLKREGYVYF